MEQVPGDTSRTELSNTIIVQNDKYIQEIWDVARTITCDWVDNYVKTVNFNPFSVGMLQSQEVKFQGDQPIECWMDLQLGKWPEVSDINSIVKIGDALSLLVFARDNNGMYDVSAKDCYAYAGPNFDDPSTPRLQLTDEEGCVLKDKLISPFQTARQDDRLGSIVVTYAYVNAFKFPDVMDVFMTCNVEICKGDCDNKCSAVTTEAPRRSGSTLFGEPIYTTKPTPFCFPGSTNPECPQPTTLPPPTPFVCIPGSRDPRCPQTTVAPPKPRCYPGSREPACRKNYPNLGKTLSPFPSSCVPGTNDPNCLVNLNIPKTTTKAPCYPGSRDVRCRKLFPIVQTTTPEPTTPPPRCFPGSTDPRCPKPLCYPGSRNPKCPPVCDNIKGPRDPRCKPKCYPGSKDKRCPQIKTTTEAIPSTTTPKCYPGSLDPDCETVTKDGRYGSILFPATITTTPTTTTTELTSPPTVPTTTPRRTGSVLFGEPSTTAKTTPVRPRLKPKTTTKSPKRGKQLAEPKSRPEPTGDEWEGESRFHAFHSFHYQRGDGRRSRVFGQRIVPKTKRSKRSLKDNGISDGIRPLQGKMPVKLSRSVFVVSAQDLPVMPRGPKKYNSESSAETVCLSTIAVTSILLLLSLSLVTLLVFVCLYVQLKKTVNK